MENTIKLMYFNYHAKIKNLICSGHATGYERLKKHNNISPCILIYFDNHRAMPIREHRFEEYEFLFAKFDVLELKNDDNK